MDGVNNKVMLDGGFLPLIFVMRGVGFISLEVVIVGTVMICIRMINMRNMYIVNK